MSSAFAVSEATTWQKRMSDSENGCESRSVRRKIAPMVDDCQRIGSTMIERTLRESSFSLIDLRSGSAAASGMNTVSPESNARFSSG